MSRKYRVLVADSIAVEGLEPLRSDDRFELVIRPGLDEDALADAIGTADAVLVRSATRITRRALERANGLRIIGRAGVGVDTIDVDAATERGIAVLTAPAGSTTAAAELTLALMLAAIRRVAAADASMKAGQWSRAKFSGTELYGKVLGLVGAGRIGLEVAKRARSFGMRVLACDPFLTAARAEANDIRRGNLGEVLAEADIISVHVPLTEATTGLIGAPEIAGMKPSAYLINAARGGVVNEEALVQALKDRRIAGAALDVYEEEPLPSDHPFRTLDNIVLTPHLGASTAEAQRSVAIEIAEAVRDALVDGDLSRAVNAPAVGGDELRRLRPLLGLAQRLGVLAAALVDGAVSSIEVRYAGSADDGLRMLVASVLVGALSPAVGSKTVNVVNSLHLARDRGISVEQVREGPLPPYAERLEVRVVAESGECHAAGALLGDSYARIVGIDEFLVNIEPSGTMLVIRNRDVPGVIGHVGTVLGGAGVNIAEYHQARRGPAGGEALAAVAVDGRVSSEVLAALRGLADVRRLDQVVFDSGG